MQSSQQDKESEEQFEIPPIGDLDDYFRDPDSNFDFGEEKANTNLGVDNESIDYPKHHLAHTSNQEYETGLVGDGMANRLESTTLAVPPPSRSNPETPKEQSDFSLGDLAPPMTRFHSEQGGLASPNPSHSDHPDNVQGDNFRQSVIRSQLPSHQTPPVSMRRSDSRGNFSQVGAIESSADSNLVTPAMSRNPHQGGLDRSVQHGFGVRHSHSRTPARPSNLRNIVSANSVSAQPADIYPSLPQLGGPNQQYMQPVADPSTAQEHFHTLRNRRHTDTATFSRNPLMNPYPIVDPDPAYGGIIGSAANYADPSRQYSPFHIPRSVHDNYGIHGHLIHHGADPHQPINQILLQSPMASSTYNLRHQRSAFQPPMHNTMKRDDSSPDSGPQRMSHQAMEETEVSQSPQIRNPGEPPSVPKTEKEKQACVNRILSAMYDTSRAQDNVGMISSWKSLMNEKEAIERVARELVEVCIRRRLLGRPFRKNAKSPERYPNFEEHFRALIEGLTTQKTMCKHLLRQPYIEEIVDDPLGSVSRITNNRKVNKGKKIAIDKGREAMGQEGKSRRSAKVPSHENTDDELDAENESFDEEQYENLLKRPSASLHQSGSADHSHDPSYREGSAPKRAKRASRSKYQLNEKNEMIDTSESPLAYPAYSNPNISRGTSRRLSDEYGHQPQPEFVMSHLRRQSYESTGPSDFSPHSASDLHSSQPENDDKQPAEYQPRSTPRPRRRGRQ